MTTIRTGRVSIHPTGLIEEYLPYFGVEVWPNAYKNLEQQIQVTELPTQLFMVLRWNAMVEKLCSFDLRAMVHHFGGKNKYRGRVITRRDGTIRQPARITVYKEDVHVHDQATRGSVTDLLLSVNTVMTWSSR
jgi:hypothetical protein